MFKAAGALCRELTGPGGTIGVRVPDSKFCLGLLAEIRLPVTAPSANPALLPPARSAREVLEYFDGMIDLIVDGGESPSAVPSTVVDATGAGPVIIREGKITEEEIKSALKGV